METCPVERVYATTHKIYLVSSQTAWMLAMYKPVYQSRRWRL